MAILTVPWYRTHSISSKKNHCYGVLVTLGRYNSFLFIFVLLDLVFMDHQSGFIINLGCYTCSQNASAEQRKALCCSGTFTKASVNKFEKMCCLNAKAVYGLEAVLEQEFQNSLLPIHSDWSMLWPMGVKLQSSGCNNLCEGPRF